MLIRLRPIVQATPTANGLHLRGWSSSCTITGGAGLWKVWQRLAPQLTSGITDLEVPEGTPPAVRAAVSLILDQLREHDMLVSMSAEWDADGPTPDVAAWLESAAADPIDAWRRLRAAVVTISGTGPLAEAAARAVAAVGLAVVRESGTQADDAELLVAAGDLVVLAGCGADVGYVLPIEETFNSFNTEATMRTVARLGLTGEPTPILATLIGSAAVHRLVCAVAGFPDPASEFAKTHPYPMALIARTNPLRATYHPLITASHLTPSALTDPWQALDALTDPELGLVDPPEFGTLPQVPAKLARSGDSLGIGTTADAARLDAALNALKSDGIDLLHATGTMLRRAALLHTGEPVDDEEWADDPAARRWWKALTERFKVPAVVYVERLARGAYKAEIRDSHHLLAWAVEATPAQTVALAALAATGYAQAGRDGTAHLNNAGPHQRDQEEALQRTLADLDSAA
ncbi:hypothetical protein [Lentzea sp. NPDC051838]|uniref:hypothetical protein n=1 Tax=Lentzea sp. NPDC051838 TaxID=3154849 RepID=UPI0034238525